MANMQPILSPAAEAATRPALQRAGVSGPGVEQFLKGQVVANPADRAKLARLMAEAMWQGFYKISLEDILVS